MKKFLFLDRDGVINSLIANDRAPRSIKELEIYEDAIFEIPKLFNLGYEVVVVTNQPDISRGLNTIENVEKINHVIKERIPSISKFFVCYHDNVDVCECRKPKPGLLLEAIGRTPIDHYYSWMVGDNFTDITAGAAVGVNTVLLNRVSAKDSFINHNVVPDYYAKSFTEASHLITEYFGLTKK